MRSPSLFCVGNFVIYISSLSMGGSSTAPELYLCVYWYGCELYYSVCIAIYMRDIQSNFWLYFVLGVLIYISPLHGSFHHCAIVTYVFLFICLWILYLFLLWYVCLLHRIYSLVVIHIGKLVMQYSFVLFVFTLLPSLLTFINKSGLTYCCLN